jgi:hypothetical protein
MAKTRSLHEKRERLEADGETHRRDCECARCEAGFTPTEHDRAVAALRAAAEQGRRAAVRAAERKRENARLKQLDLETYFRRGNAAADAEVRRLRGLRRRALADRRMDELLRLRRDGWSLEHALAEVDRRFPSDGSAAADNDNAWSGPEPDRRRSRSLFPPN